MGTSDMIEKRMLVGRGRQYDVTHVVVEIASRNSFPGRHTERVKFDSSVERGSDLEVAQLADQGFDEIRLCIRGGIENQHGANVLGILGCLEKQKNCV